jgi:hypothetical protein
MDVDETKKAITVPENDEIRSQNDEGMTNVEIEMSNVVPFVI